MAELTQLDGTRPPTWSEIEGQISELQKGLERWDRLCSAQLPSDPDRQEFLAVMSNFYSRVSVLQNKYYDLIDSVLSGYEVRRSRPDAFGLDADFDRTIKAMKSLPDVKKKWLRHKK